MSDPPCRVPRCECTGWVEPETGKKCKTCNHGQSRHSGHTPGGAKPVEEEPAQDVVKEVTEEDAINAILEHCNAVEYTMVSEISQAITWGRIFKPTLGAIGEFIKARPTHFNTSMTQEEYREGKDGRTITIRPQLMVKKATSGDDALSEWARRVLCTVNVIKERNADEEETFEWHAKYQGIIKNWLDNTTEHKTVLEERNRMSPKERMWLQAWANGVGLELEAGSDGSLQAVRPLRPIRTDVWPEVPVGRFARFGKAVVALVKDPDRDTLVFSEPLTPKQMALVKTLETVDLHVHAFPGTSCVVSKSPISEDDVKVSVEDVEAAHLDYSDAAISLMTDLTTNHSAAMQDAAADVLQDCIEARIMDEGKARKSRRSRRPPRRYPPRPDPKLLEFRKTLPAWGKRDEVLEAIRKHSVVIIAGETGSGKTTQIPQFILDDDELGEQGILVTQPRRISAIGVSTRVAEERAVSLGGEVGYQIRFESKVSDDTRLSFVTTGVFLRILHGNPNLDGYSTVVLDEVHERDRFTDFSLILLRDLMARRRDLRVVLMSATIVGERFQEYFKEVNQGELPPMVNIEGKVFPVQDYYLEDALEWTGVTMGGPMWQSSPETQQRMMELYGGIPQYSDQTLSSAARFADEPQVHPQLIAELISYMHRISGPGSFLVFLPGWAEIKRCAEAIKSPVFDILFLHSQVPVADQAKVFAPSSSGLRKVVLSTNIAETSITIPDVIVVIDSGVKKEKTYDVSSGLPKLEDMFVAKDNVMQRRGRAGRVQSGQSIHLFPRFKWNDLENTEKPEIVRSALEEVVLFTKMLGIVDVRETLRKALDPPDPKAVEDAIKMLQQIEALTDDSTEELTPLGKVLADFPCHPLVGRMLIFGSLLRAVHPITVIAGGLQGKPLFLTDPSRRKLSDASRINFTGASQSDHYRNLRGFLAWHDAERSGTRGFCKDRALSLDAMKTALRSAEQFEEVLDQARLISSSNRKNNVNSGDWEVVRAIIGAGLYPNVAQAKGFLWTADRQQLQLSEARSNVTLSPVSQGIYEYLVYSEKCVQNGKLQVMDATKMPPLLVPIFLARNLSVDKGVCKGGLAKVLVDGWMAFSTTNETADLLVATRGLISSTLQVFCSRMSARLSNRLEDHIYDIQTGLVELCKLLSVGFPSCPIYAKREREREREKERERDRLRFLEGEEREWGQDRRDEDRSRRGEDQERDWGRDHSRQRDRDREWDKDRDRSRNKDRDGDSSPAQKSSALPRPPSVNLQGGGGLPPPPAVSLPTQGLPPPPAVNIGGSSLPRPPSVTLQAPPPPSPPPPPGPPPGSAAPPPSTSPPPPTPSSRRPEAPKRPLAETYVPPSKRPVNGSSSFENEVLRFLNDKLERPAASVIGIVREYCHSNHARAPEVVCAICRFLRSSPAPERNRAAWCLLDAILAGDHKAVFAAALESRILDLVHDCLPNDPVNRRKAAAILETWDRGACGLPSHLAIQIAQTARRFLQEAV